MSQDIVVDSNLKSLIRPLTEEEFNELETAILRDGIREPLSVWEHKGKTILLDGHNRKKICDKHGVTYKTTPITKATLDGEDLDLDSKGRARIWVWHNQGARRNLDSLGWSLLTGNTMPDLAIEAKRRQDEALVENAKNAVHDTKGKFTAIPNKLGNAAKADNKHLDKHQGEAVTRAILNFAPGKTNKTYVQAILKEGGYKDGVFTHPENLKKLEMTSDSGRGRVILELIRSQRNVNNVARLKAVTSANATKLPADKEYSVLYVDCPWKYEFSETDSRKIENQYPTMSVPELCKFKVAFESGKEKSIGDLAAKDSVIFFWATAPKLQEALQVLNAWGFEYKTNAIWDKETIGMGYWFRGQHEHLMVATKGKMPTPAESSRASSVIREPWGKHSAKPDAVYALIESMYPTAARVEIFARCKRTGWDVVGNQMAADAA